MTRCPNCARKVHFWHNYSGYCSKQCRTDSITSCPNCGKVGLYKHARLGCCSEECRYWYVSGLLGYDKDALLTPAWDKVVYHVRLPSTSAEISSLQLDELEYDRAIDTVLVIAAPPWMTRTRVLAELPYERFDNTAWQHLWADGTLTEDELFRFHRLCYDDDLLCQKLGEHVFARLRQPAASLNHLSPPGYASGLLEPAFALTQPMDPPRARIAAPSTQPVPPSQFVESIRTLFEKRGYTIMMGAADNTLILHRHGRTALVAYYYHAGMVEVAPVQRALAAGIAAGATQTFVVTNGHFTLQAEDYALAHPMQLIDGDELAELEAHHRGMPTLSEPAEPAPLAENAELTPPLNLTSRQGSMPANGDGAAHGERTEILHAVDAEPHTPNGSSHPDTSAPVDAEIIGDGSAV